MGIKKAVSRLKVKVRTKVTDRENARESALARKRNEDLKRAQRAKELAKAERESLRAIKIRKAAKADLKEARMERLHEKTEGARRFGKGAAKSGKSFFKLSVKGFKKFNQYAKKKAK